MRMDYHPVGLKAFRSKYFTSLMCGCAHMCVWQWVGGRQCSDKSSELLAVLGEKAIGLTYSSR